MVRYQVTAASAGADQEVPEPVLAVAVQDRQQLVAAGERRDDDGQDVVLDQHDGHHQAQAGRQVAHRGRVRAAAFVEDARCEYMYSAPKTKLARAMTATAM